MTKTIAEVMGWDKRLAEVERLHQTAQDGRRRERRLFKTLIFLLGVSAAAVSFERSQRDWGLTHYDRVQLQRVMDDINR